MADAFIGEIRIFPFSYVPAGWYACNGQQLSTRANPALYSIIGNIYGGDQQNFKLPNLNGKVVAGVAQLQGFSPIGSTGGSDTASLNLSQIPSHTHTLEASISPSTTATPDATMYPAILAPQGTKTPAAYTQATAFPTNRVAMSPTALAQAGSATPSAHNNDQPTQLLLFCINVDGTYPSFP